MYPFFSQTVYFTSNLEGREKTMLERWLQTKGRGTKEGRSQPTKEPDENTEQGKDLDQETEEIG